LGITARSPLGENTLSFNPGLARRHGPVLADRIFARVAAIAGGRYWTRNVRRSARVIFKPKPLRSSSHQMMSRSAGQGRASMVRFVSLQTGMEGGTRAGYLASK
jgi:hypothetical protein